MSRRLAQLRMELDFFPSPIEDRPGLVLRDPYRYSDTTLILPPLFAQALSFYDGEHTDLDIRAHFAEVTGELQVSEMAAHLDEALSTAGFLHDDAFYALRDKAWHEFADAPDRQAAHAREGGYPEDPAELERTFDEYLAGEDAKADENLIAIAAPHVSPFGGVASYRAAYRSLGSSHRDRTFVILGTSHYGAPDRLGLTKKDFVTPYGTARTDQALVAKLAADCGSGAAMEDYCHSFEHSIEFQVVFLQHVYGPDVKILPILVGSYATSLMSGAAPEAGDGVKRLLDGLSELHAREGKRLCWVLGVDMAHMGARYGDEAAAEANRGAMEEVALRDRARIERLSEGDADGFWRLVQPNHDDLKWCGSAPFYTFLKAVPEARGSLRNYEQWNIDEGSVVTFAGMSFRGTR
ncbi:MAG: AmmeMemoRadiSam system protein B [Bryobacteraceae bacterium]